jgi:hypothetical protein
MSNHNLMICERCGTEGATPCEIEIQQPGQPDNATTTLFALCPDCQSFVASIQPLQSEDEITSDSNWLSRIDPIVELANDISAMQQQIDQLRARITDKKKKLRLNVRSLDESLNDAQWQRMIDEQRMSGELSAIFWLEKYRRR